MGTIPSSARSGRDHRYYYLVSACLLGLVFAGFARTYYLKDLFSAPPLPPLVHVHGIVMTVWYLLFPVQVGLIAARRTRLHRQLGVAGVFLAGIAAVLAAFVSVGLARDQIHQRPESAPTAALLLGLQLFSVLLVFAILISLGMAYRRRPEYHKRFMTMAMLSVLGPAITRLPLSFVRNHDVRVAIILSVSFVLICVLADTVLNRRLHPAFGWSASLVIGSMFVVAPLAQTEPWVRFVRWLVR